VNQNSTTEKENLNGLLGSIGFVLSIAIVKYWPPLTFGLVIGLLVYAGAASARGRHRVLAHALGLVFFALVLFVLTGAPLAPPLNALRFPGLLFFWDEFSSLIRDAVKWWNSGPISAILRPQRIDPRLVSELTVSQYLWLSFPAAAFSSVLSDLMRRLKGQVSWSSHEESRRSFLSIPAQAVWLLYLSAFQMWLLHARDSITQGEKTGVRAILKEIIGAIIFLVVGALVSSYIVAAIPYYDLREGLSVLCFAPGVAILVGTILGAGQWVLTGFDIRPRAKEDEQGGFELGRDRRGKLYWLTNRNLAYHVEVVASSGAGKTNLIKNLLYDRIKRGHSVVFLDLKADFDVVSWMLAAARSVGREQDLRLVSLADPDISVPYNPIAGGSAAEIHSQLMNAWQWSNEYYRSVSSVALMSVLQGLCAWRDATGENFHLGHVYQLLDDPGVLRMFAERLSARRLPSSREIARLAEKLDRPSERKDFAGLIANLNQILYSAAGTLISHDVEQGESLDFKESTDEGRITYFLMNSLKLKESAQTLGKLVLQDLMRVVGDRYATGERGLRPVTLIVDEFGAFAIPEFIEFMDRARGAGVGIVIAHQSRADLAAISPEFLKRVEANANTKIVGSLEDADDREYYAKILGTRKTKKETVQVEDGFFGETPTGIKSVREVEEFIVHPNELADLARGTVFTVSRTVDRKHGFVRTPLAPEAPARARAEVVSALRLIREGYMKAGGVNYLDLAAFNPNVNTGLTRDLKVPEVEKDFPVEAQTPAPTPTQTPDLWS
jgi:hypothetical protein